MNEAVVAGTGLNLRLNFNDFLGAIMVLVALLVSNNWNTITDLFCYATGQKWWPRLYFCSFFFLVALIILNIIISFVLEVYDALGSDVESQLRKERNLERLSKALPTGQGLEELVKRAAKDEKKAKK